MIIAILAIYCLSHAIGWLGVLILGKRFQKSSIYGWAFIIAVVGWIYTRPHIGFKEPGHWFERGEYTIETVVNIFPDGATSKNYRVPGKIHATHHDEIDYGDGASGGDTRVYYLESVRFPNGGTLQFEDAAISLYRTEGATDASGKYWRIEFAR